MDQPDVEHSIATITRSGTEAARRLLESWGTLARAVVQANPLLNQRRTGCCEIPPACWLPRSLGEFVNTACPCGTALVRLRVTNCQPVASTVDVRVHTESALDIKVTPQHATLQPMERKWFTVVATVPDDACRGDACEVLVWVAGCNEHYLRWTVRIAEAASGECQEVAVEDCPDYVHHWYDHFYCQRPCFSPKHEPINQQT